MVQYYVACKRELWFFGNKINMDYESDDIKVGRLIHKESYKRENKEIMFEDVAFDFVKIEGDNAIIFEIKKSSKLREPVKFQLYYYLWYALKHGTKAKGVILYKKEKKKEQIELNDQIIREIEMIVADIPNVISMRTPPHAIKKPYCKGCAYYSLCWV